MIAAEARSLKLEDKNVCEIFKPELTVPVSEGAEASRSHCALHVLGMYKAATSSHESKIHSGEQALSNMCRYNSSNRFSWLLLILKRSQLLFYLLHVYNKASGI